MKTFLYIIGLFFSVSVLAQPKLGMHPSYTITPAVATSSAIGIAYADTITVKCFVQNKGNALFNGSILLLKSVHSSSLQTSAVPVSSLTAILNPGDSVLVSFIDTIKPASYKVNGNGNTIVVWPVSSSAITKDSLFTIPVYVNTQIGIKELDRNKLFIYPNPVSQTLFIRPETGVEYKEITIYDLQLKTLIQRSYADNIDVGLLPSGTYIITVTDHKGTRYGSRFTKSD